MSVNVVRVDCESESGLNEAWQVKEQIRHHQGLLQQAWSFFRRAYREGDVYHAIDETDEILGFAIMNKDDYLSLLAVHPECQGIGIGKQLIREIQSDYQRISCHTRVSNTKAIQFYESIGFEVVTVHTAYYDNDDDAYILESFSDPDK